MPVTKLTISLEPSLSKKIKKAAKDAKLSVSAWLAEAGRARLRDTAMDEMLADYEAEFGAFTDEEMRQASKELGLPWPPRKKS